MDKTIKPIAYSSQTIAKGTKAIGYKLSAMVFSLLVLLPVAGLAAETANEKAPSALEKAIAAGKAAVNRALSSKAKEMDAEAIPTVTTAIVGKADAAREGVTAKTTAKGVGAVAVQDVQRKLVSKKDAAVPVSKGAAPAKLSSMEGKAKETEQKKEPMTTKTVSGEISSKNVRGISLVYGVDKKTDSQLEMLIPFSDQINLQGYRTVAEVVPGDKVSVTYEETKEGGFKRAVKSLKLVDRPSYGEGEENPYLEGETTP